MKEKVKEILELLQNYALLSEEEVDRAVQKICQLVEPKGQKPPVLSDEIICEAMIRRMKYEITVAEMITDGFLGEQHRAIAQAQRDAGLHYIEQARQETEAISYSKGVLDGRKQVAREIFEEIGKKCSLEVQNIHSPSAWDKIIIRRGDLQALKNRLGGEK